MGDFISPKEFGKRLRPPVSPTTVHRWINAKQLPAHNVSLSKRPTWKIDEALVARVQERFDVGGVDDFLIAADD